MTLFVERLTRQHDRTRFACGETSLDNWFRHQAGQAELRRFSPRVFVLVDDEIAEGTVPLGYYALVAHSVELAELPPTLAKDLPPNYAVGAALLARLAIDQSQQGRGLGQTLLADVVRTVISADEHVATPLLVVDALNEQAAAFYMRYDFVRFSDNLLRLGARIRDIRLTFGS